MRLTTWTEPKTENPAEEAVMDFGKFALDAIHKLQSRVRELEAQLEERDRELELALAKVEAKR